MKNRVIKFRHWCPESQEMTPFEKIRLLPTDTMFHHLFEPDMLGGILMQFTGLHDKRNKRDVFESDIYFEEDAQDNGDRRIYFVITWINERCAFAMLEVSEYHNYVNNGFDAIERDFDGFYFEVMQSSIDKMHYAGNIYQPAHSEIGKDGER